MKKSLYGASIELPNWVVDNTWYTFKPPTGKSPALTIQAIGPVFSNIDAATMQRREDLRVAYAGSGTVSEPVEDRSCQWPSRRFTLMTESLRATIAIVETPGELAALTFTYDVLEAPVFDVILRSLRLTGSLPRIPTPGFVSRAYHHLVLDVPASLAPPKNFVFRALDLEIKIARGIDSRLIAPDIEARFNLQHGELWQPVAETRWTNMDSPDAAIEWQTQDILATNELGTQTLRSYAARVALVPSGDALTILATARAAGCADLAAEWATILHTVKGEI